MDKEKILEKAKAFFATTAGRAVAALLVAVAIVAYAHHRGVVTTTAKFTAQIAELNKKLSDAEAKPAPAPEIQRDEKAEADMADRLKQAETAKANLEKKVKDYETQLARRPAKAEGALLCLPLTLAACQTLSEATPQERMDIKSCVRLANTIELPPIKAGSDARVVIARYRAALVAANANIQDTKACMALLDRAEQDGKF